MKSFSLRSGDMEFAWWEDGVGQTALLLHGFTGCKENWNLLGCRLAGERRVLAVDLPGHGKSSAPADVQQYSMMHVNLYLAGMLDQMEINRVDLVGYSMGGRLGLYFALEYPQRVRSLVLESASPGLQIEEERMLRRQSDYALAQRIERNGMVEFVREWESLPLFASQAGLDDAARLELRARRMENRPLGLANSLRGMGSGVQPELWSRLWELQMPVMLIVGAIDEKFAELNRRMAAMISQVRLEIVPEAGHTVHLEKPDVYENLLREFWN